MYPAGVGLVFLQVGICQCIGPEEVPAMDDDPPLEHKEVAGLGVNDSGTNVI